MLALLSLAVAAVGGSLVRRLRRLAAALEAVGTLLLLGAGLYWIYRFWGLVFVG